MPIDLKRHVHVANPGSLHLGGYVVVLGLVMLAVGIITNYTDELVFPAMIWCVASVPSLAIGTIFIVTSVRRR